MIECGQRARDILVIIAWVTTLATAMIVVSALMPGLHELADRWGRLSRRVREMQSHNGRHRMEGPDGRVGESHPQVADSPDDGGSDTQNEEAKT